MDRRLVAAIRQRRYEVGAEAFVEMRPRRVAVAKPREHRAETLMRLRMIGIDVQGAFIMLARTAEIAAVQQQIGEIDVTHGVRRMVRDRFRIDAAGGGGEIRPTTGRWRIR